MKKRELMELKVGDLVISKRDESIGRVIRVQEDNFLIDNSVTIRKASVSTMIRWYNLYVEEEIPEVVEPQDTQDSKEDDQLHEDNDTTVKTDVISRDTATSNTLNSIVEAHGCKLERKKEYIKVSKEGVKKTLVYIRTPRQTGYHFDIAKRTWNKLTSEYQAYLIETFNACIVDKTKGLWRISCKELDVFEVILLTALQIA